MSKPKCPRCGRPGKKAGRVYICSFGHMFDDNPDEGGTHDDRDPSRRLEKQEELAQARKRNEVDRPRSARGFRFDGQR